MPIKSNFWRDECGLVLSAELVIILTIVVLGLIVGLTCVQQAVVAELQDIGGAFRNLNQSYAFTGFRGCPKFWGRTSWTAGSAFYDRFSGCVNGNCLNGDCSIGVGGGWASGLTYVAPGPSVTPKVDTAPCTTCPDAKVPVGPQPIPETRDPNCQGCQPLPGSAVPMPMPEIPQGPVPQSLPQL